MAVAVTLEHTSQAKRPQLSQHILRVDIVYMGLDEVHNPFKQDRSLKK